MAAKVRTDSKGLKNLRCRFVPHAQNCLILRGMDRRSSIRAPEEQPWTQTALVEACARAAATVHDPRLKSAWVGVLARVMHACAATGAVIANLKRDAAPLHSSISRPAPPTKPAPASRGGDPPQFRKTTSDGFSSRISGLAARRASPPLRPKSKGGAPTARFSGSRATASARSQTRRRRQVACDGSARPPESRARAHAPARRCR
jgi:hypothetical protein